MNGASDVLIVEDDGSTRTLLATLVARNHLVPVEAADGRSGLDLLRRFKFRAVLLDLLLPELSGLDILAYLAKDRRHVLPRVVVITAAAEANIRNNVNVRACSAFIKKPFDILEVERAFLACCALDGDGDGKARDGKTGDQSSRTDV